MTYAVSSKFWVGFIFGLFLSLSAYGLAFYFCGWAGMAVLSASCGIAFAGFLFRDHKKYGTAT